MSEEKFVRLIAKGRVQGVGYRAFVEQGALELGISGWVRNRRDGSVEAVIAGSLVAVEKMIEACKRGPRFGRVDALDVQEASAADLKGQRPGERFSVLPTI